MLVTPRTRRRPPLIRGPTALDIRGNLNHRQTGADVDFQATNLLFSTGSLPPLGKTATLGAGQTASAKSRSNSGDLEGGNKLAI
jgi:hypothetical protein